MPTRPPAPSLHASTPVAWRRAACLRSRLHGSSCRACEQACPAGCLQAGEGGVSLAAGCTGCGRCRAACPTGALAAAGFELEAFSPPPGRAAHCVVACARAPSQPHQLRVPCLGGLSAADLLWLCAQAPEHTVLLRDEGGCLDCDSGGELDPAHALLEQVRALMSEVGVPPERLPRRVTTSDGRRARTEDPMQSAGRARRGFFAALARPQPAAVKQPAAKAPSAVRERMLQALDALARRHGGALPASLFPSLEAAPSCGGHRVCAAVCPTGALVRYRDERAGRNGIAFAARDCIACGHCVAACPEKALRLRPGAGAADAGRRLLTSFVQRECADCGAHFAAAPQDPARRCPRCHRSAALASAAFNTLFVPTFHEEAR